MPSAIPSILLAALIAGLSVGAQAAPLRIVSEAWAPYIYEEQGELRGLDYEVARTVLQRLKVEVEWQLMPWKRCLLAVEQDQAEAILDIFKTDERLATFLYPGEPLSEIEFVLFYAKQQPHSFASLKDLKGLKIGVSPGYWYANRAFRESTEFERELAPSHAANFGKLLRQRVDLVINDRRAGSFLLKEMALDQTIDHHPRIVSRDRLYLGLRRSAGLDELARRFTEELRRFKTEPGYQALVAHYEGLLAAGSDSPEAAPAQATP